MATTASGPWMTGAEFQRMLMGNGLRDNSNFQYIKIRLLIQELIVEGKSRRFGSMVLLDAPISTILEEAHYADALLRLSPTYESKWRAEWQSKEKERTSK